jgi:hypothetical protein
MNLKEFQKAFIAWMSHFQELTYEVIIAIDRKRLRGPYNQADKSDTISMVSAFAADNEVVLRQNTADTKSNGTAVIPKLLTLLYTRGCLITNIAMGCQTRIAKKNY